MKVVCGGWWWVVVVVVVVVRLVVKERDRTHVEACGGMWRQEEAGGVVIWRMGKEDA